MIKLDDNLLAELGLSGLPKEEKTAFLKHMYETLEMRVGTKLAEKMSDSQMTEFEQFINSNDEQGAFHWLEANFPNYKDVVAAEFEKLKVEVKPLASQILASSAAHAQQLPPQQPQQVAQDPAAYAPQQPQPQPMPPAPAPPAYQPQPSQAPAFDPSANAFAPTTTAAPYPQPQDQPAPAPQHQPQMPLPPVPPAPAAPPQYPQPIQPPPYTPPPAQ